MTKCVTGLPTTMESIAKQIYMILTFCSLVLTSPMNMTYYDEPTTTQLQKLIIAPHSGEIIVGGRNVLLRIRSDMKLADRITTGPVIDGILCAPKNTSNCLDADTSNNDASVLVAKKPQPRHGSYFLFCGTVYQGLCSVYSIKDLHDKDELNSNNNLNLIGNRQSSVAFFGISTTFGTRKTALYVGSTYDGRPLEYASQAVSARKLDQNPRNQRYDVSYIHSKTSGGYNHISAIDIEEGFKKNFPVRYIYGFEHGGYSYFLTVQKRSVYADDYVTHLVRVCQKDPLFYSYTEITLSCRRAEYEPIYFNIAKAAYLGPVGEEMRIKSRYTDSEQVLYVAFGRNRTHADGTGSDEAAPEYGTAMCMYSMTSIRADFKKAQQDCFRGYGNWPTWIQSSENDCKSNMDVRREIDDQFCGHRDNRAIAGRFPFLTVANVTTKEDMVTAIRVVTQKNKTIAIMGTHRGTVLKVIINGNNVAPYANISVMNSSLGHVSVTEMELSSDEKHAYVLTANRITKVPIQACNVHTTCAACVTSGDPLGCGWCEERDNRGCTTRANCRSNFRWYNNSCPPIIHSFSPANGPFAGGTRIEILGENFGTKNMTNGKPSVYLQRIAFKVEEFNWTRIVAVSPENTQKMSALIEVEATDSTYRQFDVEGRGYSPTTFAYREVSINNFSPNLGPESGGTRLTITGQHLDIGSSLKVLLNDGPCKVVMKSEESIECLTSPWTSEFERKYRFQSRRSVPDMVAEVSVEIDAERLEFPSKKFTYSKDPEITDVEPRDSILSGGLDVTVTGRYLNTVAHPRLIAKVAGGEGQDFEGKCVARQNGQVMICSTPDLSKSGVAIFPDQPISVDCSFRMDGVKRLREFASTHARLSRFTYYVDPEFEQFDDGLRVFYLDAVMLTIRGRYLDYVDMSKAYVVTIGQKPCNVTEIGRPVLVCRPEKPDENGNLDITYPVVVRVANKTYNIGNLQFARPTQNATIIKVIIIFGILFLFAIIAGCVLYYMKRNNKGYWKVKRAHGEHNVHYTAGAHVQVGPPHERFYQMNSPNEDQRMASENSYWINLSSNQPPPVAQAPETVIDDEARRLIDDAKLLISRDNLLLMDVIGQGHFGCVYRGFLKMEGTKQEDEVAVKTLKSLTVGASHSHSMTDQSQSYTASVECRKFLEEALRMREFEHANILRLIGIALDKEDMPLVVLPFMKHGDLLSYIRNENNSPTVKELMNFAIQIAEGMAYLANLKFVHRDLAARNCMLDDSMNVKVADFGLSRDIYERDYYSSDDPKAKLPVKWMAPESLEKGTYNTKTDVWSYGVVVWELMTRGVCPYPEVDNWDITKFLKEGRRMPQPSYCPDALYGIMLQCWDTLPKLRPVFQELVQNIRAIILSMERAHEKVNITYVNVPTSQPYLYPLGHEGGAVGTSSTYPTGIATISNGNPRIYPPYHPVPGGAANVGSRSTLV